MRKQRKDYKINPIEKTKAIARLGYNISLEKTRSSWSWGPKAQIYDDKASRLNKRGKIMWAVFHQTEHGEGQAGCYHDMVKDFAHPEQTLAEQKEQRLKHRNSRERRKSSSSPWGWYERRVHRKGAGLQESTFMIPIQPKNEERILQSVQAKYTNPLPGLLTRIIKYVRGHWGVLTLAKMESTMI